MNVISAVRLTAFRGFKDSGTLRFAPLTFLVGPNSSGKSSILDGILLIAQSTNGIFWRNPEWMGRLIDLGSFEDSVYRHNVDKAIVIQLVCRIDPRRTVVSAPDQRTPKEISFTWRIRRTTSGSSVVSSLRVHDVTSGASIGLARRANGWSITLPHRTLFIQTGRSDIGYEEYLIPRRIERSLNEDSGKLRHSRAGYLRITSILEPSVARFFSLTERVSSARTGPKRWVPKGTFQEEPGERGLLNDPYTIIQENRTSHRPRKKFEADAVSFYLNRLGIAKSIKREDLSVYHGALFVQDNVTKVLSNLADVGYGASQAIPVIRGCVSGARAPLVLEQPEIHLHPRAQGQLAELICQTSLKRQVLVETHSEHIINRARIMVAEKKIPPESISILYVDRDSAGSVVTQIGIDENGDFDKPWPSGFFDERYHDSMKLLELKSKHEKVLKISKPRGGRAGDFRDD